MTTDKHVTLPRSEADALGAPTTIPAKPEKAEKIPAPTFIHVNASAMLAALSCASTEEARYYLAGVYVHRTKDGIRLVSTDGHRLLIQSSGHAIEGQDCDWLDDGVIVSSDGLKARLKLLEDGDTGDVIKLGFAPGSRHVTLCDLAGNVTFRVDAVDGHFPDYAKVVKAATGAFVGEIDRLRPAPFASRYIKAVGDLGAKIGAEAVTIYQPAQAEPGADGKPVDGFDGPAVVTFHGAPHALLYLMPMNKPAGFSAQQVAILSPAIRLSVAALRAHETRNRTAAKREKDATAKAGLLAAADRFKARVDELLASTRAALPAPETPKPAPVPPVAPTTVEAEPEAEKPKAPTATRGAVAKPARRSKANGHAAARA